MILHYTMGRDLLNHGSCRSQAGGDRPGRPRGARRAGPGKGEAGGASCSVVRTPYYQGYSSIYIHIHIYTYLIHVYIRQRICVHKLLGFI